MRLLRSSSVTPNCAPSRRICWHRAQLRGGAVLAAAGQADAPGSNRRARPLRRLCGSRAQTSPHRPKGPRRRRGCNRREPAVPDAARGDRPRPALAPRRASRACYRLPSFARKAGSVAPASSARAVAVVVRAHVACLGRRPGASSPRRHALASARGSGRDSGGTAHTRCSSQATVSSARTVMPGCPLERPRRSRPRIAVSDVLAAGPEGDRVPRTGASTR